MVLRHGTLAASEEVVEVLYGWLGSKRLHQEMRTNAGIVDTFGMNALNVAYMFLLDVRVCMIYRPSSMMSLHNPFCPERRRES